MFLTIRNIGLPFGCDTDIFLAAAHAVLLGQNPLNVHGYIYPPTLAILLVPMALVPAPVNFWIWMVFVWCSTGALVWALHHLVGWRVAAIAVLALPATYVSAYAGNVNAFIALGWVLALLAVQARRPIHAALWLVSGTMIKLVPGVGLAVLAVRRNWRALGAACIIAGSVVVVSLPVVGLRAWTDGVLSAATMPVEDRVMILISWTGILEAARAPTWIIIAFIVGCIALLLLRAPHIDAQWAISAASLSPLLVARITWSTHLVMALPALALIWSYSPRGRRIATITWVALVAASAAPDPFHLAPIALTICLVVCLWPTRFLLRREEVQSHAKILI